jgi:aromatic ring hydroxylase
LEDLTASPFARLAMVTGLHGGGSPEAEKLAIICSFDLESREKMAKKAVGLRARWMKNNHEARK